jgi:hypothetical protein
MTPFGKPWAIGVALVIAFAILGELAVVFGDYVFHRLRLNRNIVLGALWILPLAASYIATRYSTDRKLLAGLSFLLVVPFIGALAHLVSGALGANVDFEGLSGGRIVFGIYLITGGLVVIIGTILGLLPIGDSSGKA